MCKLLMKIIDHCAVLIICISMTFIHQVFLFYKEISKTRFRSGKCFLFRKCFFFFRGCNSTSDIEQGLYVMAVPGNQLEHSDKGLKVFKLNSLLFRMVENS